jgi:hypothetical protein
VTLFTHRNAGGRCPCGAANAACGPPSDVVPVDQRIEEVAAVSGPLKKYRVKRGGVETVMKLNDADAKRLGVGPESVVGAASTIPLVAPVDEGGDGDGAADDSDDVQAVAAADAGAGTEPVQSAADSGGDGQTPGDPAAAPDPGDEKEATVTEADETTVAAEPADPDDSGTAVKASAKAPAKKTAAKRATSANKARPVAANKAESPGG